MTDFRSYLNDSLAVITALGDSLDASRVEQAVTVVLQALEADKAFLICGNGGSAADASHIAGELVGRFLKERRALKAIALSADSAILTAWGNDYSYDDVFARQVHAYGEPGAVLLAISTSGRSKNVVAAVTAAKSRGMMVIGLTGKGGGHLAPMVDILLDVPSSETPLIQQAHMCLYHYLCAEVEARLAPR